MGGGVWVWEGPSGQKSRVADPNGSRGGVPDLGRGFINHAAGLIILAKYDWEQRLCVCH